MGTSSKLWVNNGLYPQETSVATLYRVLPRQRLDLFTIILSSRKFAECLYCDATPPLILLVLSRFIEFTCHMQLYSCTVIQITFIHTFIQLYIHTLILSHINAYTSYTQYQFIHGCISHPKSCLVVSFQFGPHLSLCQANNLQPLFIFLCQANSLQLPFCYFCGKLIACKHLYIPFESG